MKKFLFIIPLLLLSGCNQKKSLEQLREEAHKIDQEAVAIFDQQCIIEDSLHNAEADYFESGEAPELKVKVDSLQNEFNKLDSILNGYGKQLQEYERICKEEYNTYCL